MGLFRNLKAESLQSSHKSVMDLLSSDSVHQNSFLVLGH